MTVTPDTPMIAVEDLAVAVRGGAPVVEAISFSVATGEVLGIVGESGSGKSTAALALLGHARRGLCITGGRVTIAGRDMLRLSPAELRAARGNEISYVPQDPGTALNPALRIGRQLTDVIQAHPGGHGESADERAMDVLEDVRLVDAERVLRSYPHQLSGGQQQRVLLAMAFACRPAVVVMDEPTTGLDVSTQRHLMETIHRLCAVGGASCVYVSHDLTVVAQLATNIAVMYAGRIVEHGPAAGVFHAPSHPYTQALLSAVPTPERRTLLKGIPGHPPAPGRRPGGCSYAPRCTFAIDGCRNEPVPITAVDDGGHWARCLRCDEIAPPRTAPVAPHSVRVNVTSTAGTVLNVERLTAHYGKAGALHDVSFAVPLGGRVAIVGESGSGKTTLARCVAGLHRNWSGTVELAGRALPRDARSRQRESLRQIQYIFQNPYGALNPRYTAGRIVEQSLEQFFELPRGERRRRVEEQFEAVSLSADLIDCYPDELSGGERQRVAIARALIVEPTMLICDEITSALDVSVQAVVVETLAEIQRSRSLAMLFITHNIGLVRNVADVVLVLSDGALLERGTTDDVLDRPTDEYTVQLMQDVPRLATQPAAVSSPGKEFHT